MSTSLQLIRNYEYSPLTLERVSKKQTEKGKLKELSSITAFQEAYKDEESVFLKIFNTMRLNADNRCACGAIITNKNGYRRIENTFKYRCRSCKRTISPLAFTPLRGTHLDLHKIMHVIYYCIQHKYHLSAKVVERLLGLDYEIALKLMHRIMEWMGLVCDKYHFDGTVTQVDEVHIKIPFVDMSDFHQTGRSTKILRNERNKPILVITGDDGKAKAFVISDKSAATIRPLIKESIGKDCVIWTDGAPVYNFLSRENYVHQSCNHTSKPKKWSVDGVNVNRTEAFNSYIKGKVGTIHRGVSEEYLQHYVNEACFMFSNRWNDAFTTIENMFNALPPLNSAIIENEKNKLKQ